MTTSIHELKQGVIDFFDDKITARKLAELAGKAGYAHGWNNRYNSMLETQSEFKQLDQLKNDLEAAKLSTQLMQSLVAEREHELKGMRDAISGEQRNAISDAYVRGYDMVNAAIADKMATFEKDKVRLIKIAQTAQSLVADIDDKMTDNETHVIGEALDKLRELLK